MNLGTEGIKKQAQELIDQAYQRGYKDGENSRIDECAKALDEAVIAGRNEAWDAAKRIIGDSGDDTLYCKDLMELFGSDDYDIIMRHFSATEVIEKIREWEEKQKQQTDSEISVGDEVYTLDETYHSVVTNIYDNYGRKKAVVITQSGKWDVDDIEHLHKTGRHFDEIEYILKQMGGDENASSD